MTGGRDFVAPAGDGVRLAVKLTPKASRTALAGLAPDADGGRVLKASVTAAPVNGRANAALVKLLARELGLPPTAFALIAGAADRRKLLHIAGDPAALTALLRKRFDVAD